jgi:hypothetical protein
MVDYERFGDLAVSIFRVRRRGKNHDLTSSLHGVSSLTVFEKKSWREEEGSDRKVEKGKHYETR